MTPFHLHNKTILVTGASSGIGRRIAIGICEMGGNAILTGRSNERLNETLGLLKSGANKIICCDLCKKADLQKLVEQLPLLDGVVNCAGMVKPLPIKFLSNEKIEET